MRGPTTRLVGPLKVAEAASPSRDPATPENPARVLTRGCPPPGGARVTARTLFPAISVKYRVVAASRERARPQGLLRLANTPTPLAAPSAPEPTRVVTASPMGVERARIFMLAVSAMYKTPKGAE